MRRHGSWWSELGGARVTPGRRGVRRLASTDWDAPPDRHPVRRVLMRRFGSSDRDPPP